MSIKLKIDKRVEVSDTQAKTYTVTLNVTEAVGITPNIFVLRYYPGSKYSGPEKYTFWNVAYLDELSSVTDQHTNKQKSYEIRKSCFTHSCDSQESLNEFMRIVISDIQRLIKSVEQPGQDMLHSNIDITAETALELPSSDRDTTSASSENIADTGSVVSLSFTGE